jgi:NAD+ diphosphatase
MILTPATFTPVLAALEHAAPMTFVFRGDEVLVREGDFAFPDVSTCESLGITASLAIPVGLLGDVYCRTAWLPPGAVPAEGFAFAGLRALFGNLDDEIVAVAGRARQIADWARTHRFCGACGAKSMPLEGERAMKCPSCGHIAYPRISPAMMVLVKRGREILLARHNRLAGRFTALAGFLEPGESVEDAVHREVREEVGLEVKELRYFASQSWPFPHSLMIAFTAEYAGGEIRTDAAEIAEARWFGPGDALPELSIRQSIARALIDANLPR